MKIHSLRPYSDYLSWLMQEISNEYTYNPLNSPEFRYNYRSDRFIELKLTDNDDDKIPSGHDNYCFYAYNHFFDKYFFDKDKNQNTIQLYGVAGSGKTTFIFHVLHAYYNDFCYFYKKTFKLIPIYFSHRDFKEKEGLKKIESKDDLLKRHNQYERINAYLESMEKNYSDFVEKYRNFYILDDFQSYEELIDIKKLIASIKNDEKIFILSNNKKDIENVKKLEVCDLYDESTNSIDKKDNRKVIAFIRSFLRKNQKKLNIPSSRINADIINFIDNKLVSESLTTLSKNPRYLGFLLAYHFIENKALPETRFDLYQDILKLEINPQNNEDILKTDDAQISFLSLVLSKITSTPSKNISQQDLNSALQDAQLYIINYCGLNLLNQIKENPTDNINRLLKHKRSFVYNDHNNHIHSANHPLESFILSYYTVEKSLINAFNTTPSYSNLVDDIYRQLKKGRYDSNNYLDNIIYLLLDKTNLSYTLSTIFQCFDAEQNIEAKKMKEAKKELAETLLQHLTLESYHHIEETKVYVLPLIILQLIAYNALANSSNFSYAMQSINNTKERDQRSIESILSTTDYLIYLCDFTKESNRDYSFKIESSDNIDYNTTIQALLSSNSNLYQKAIEEITKPNDINVEKRPERFNIIINNIIFILTSILTLNKVTSNIDKKCHQQLEKIKSIYINRTYNDIKQVIFANINLILKLKENKEPQIPESINTLSTEPPLTYSINAANIVNFKYKDGKRNNNALENIKKLHPYHHLIIKNTPGFLKLLYHLTALIELIVDPDNKDNEDNKDELYDYLKAKVSDYAKYYPQQGRKFSKLDEDLLIAKIFNNISAITINSPLKVSDLDEQQAHLILRSYYYSLLNKDSFYNKASHKKSLQAINDLFQDSSSVKNTVLNLCQASASYNLTPFTTYLNRLNDNKSTDITTIVSSLKNNQEIHISALDPFHTLINDSKKITAILGINDQTLASFIENEFINAPNSAVNLFNGFYKKNKTKRLLSYNRAIDDINHQQVLSKYTLDI